MQNEYVNGTYWMALLWLRLNYLLETGIKFSEFMWEHPIKGFSK